MLVLRLLIIAAALIIGPVAKANHLVFACYGEMRRLGVAGIGHTPEKYSLALKIDLEARTLTIGNYQPVPFLGITDDDLTFMAKPEMTTGISTGGFNRITGALWTHIISLEGGLLGFDGICKPAKKLF